MKYTILAALIAFPAHASGPGTVYDDPHVTPPACVSWFGILPCHTQFDYINPEGDEPRDTPRQSTPEPEEEEQCK